MSSTIRVTVLRPLLVLALAVVGVGALFVTARPVAAQPDPRVAASAHYGQGKKLFDAGDFKGAITEFTAADQLAPSPVNDYNIALAYEHLGDGAAAIRAYRSYLDRMPNAPNRLEVETSIARLDAGQKQVEAARQAEAARAAAEAEAEAARQSEAARQAMAARAGQPPVATGPVTYPVTGDRELDRVAAVDLAAARGAQPLPPPAMMPGSAAAPAPTTAAAPAPSPDQPVAKKKKPFYSNPVFWVLAGVGVYVVYVLASSDSNTTPQPGVATGLLSHDLGRGPAAPGGLTLRF